MDLNGQGLTTAQVEDLLHEVYGFPPLEEEVEIFTSRLASGRFGWDHFKVMLCQLKEEINDRAKCAT